MSSISERKITCECGKCGKCIRRQKYHNDPEFRKKVRESSIKYIRKKFSENPEFRRKSFELLNKSHIDKILRDHEEELKDDPERLTEEFIRKTLKW